MPKCPAQNILFPQDYPLFQAWEYPHIEQRYKILHKREHSTYIICAAKFAELVQKKGKLS